MKSAVEAANFSFLVDLLCIGRTCWEQVSLGMRFSREKSSFVSTWGLWSSKNCIDPKVCVDDFKYIVTYFLLEYFKIYFILLLLCA